MTKKNHQHRASPALSTAEQQALEQSLGNTHGEHPTDIDLAAWIDGILASERGDEISAHLATCSECRALAMDVGGFDPHQDLLGEVDSISSPAELPGLAVEGRRRPWKSWALAASLFFAIAAWRLMSWQPDLAQLEYPRLAMLSHPLETAEALRALQGDWPQVAGFEMFRLPSGASLLRGSEAPSAPVPLAPRWSTVRELRPALRLFTNQPEVTILIVDETERAVATFTASPDADSGEIALPATVADLESGRAYAWQVMAAGPNNDTEAPASAFVPFRVLSIAARDRLLNDELTAKTPIARAWILAEAGLIDESLDALEHIEDSDLRESLTTGLLSSRNLPPKALRSEIDRRRQP